MMLKKEEIENFTGYAVNLTGAVKPLRNGYWRELDFFLDGDAPKSFISFYEYEEDSKIRRNKPTSWPRYIAKVGHKWYPNESISEYLLNRIGEVLGLKMASSQLIMAGDQLRFLSRHFLKKNESLEHGAQIFAAHLFGDEAFVKSIEKDGLARKFFSFQFAEKAFASVFPDQSSLIQEDFVRMLVFDAITGNNDRHFYNWGVITHIRSKKTPTFAPIYDSARGLFWNIGESSLLEKWGNHPKQLEVKIIKYAEASKPKIGWDGIEDLNHFDLMEKIFRADSRFCELCVNLVSSEKQQAVFEMIDAEFSAFFSPFRKELIKKCLTYRFRRLTEIFIP